MLSLQILSFHNNPPASLPPIPLYNKPNTLFSHLLVHTDDAFKKRWSHPSSFSSCIVHAVEKDSQHFEVDPDKAREALQKLDQQLQSLSQKQIKPPKIRASDVDLKEVQMTEEMPEISESFLANSAVALFLFTIFYNVLFITVIKPAIDGPDRVVPATTSVVEASKDQINYWKQKLFLALCYRFWLLCLYALLGLLEIS
ncbi:hypothetical protein CMV_004165 [Castanea mollissima]|uniref:Uncharacterized protein n=1 Tax=Castanea mollissima TaxID=60419 RepID=A0A8J4RFI6_9ROSI|nr:hypothetical protein CMV_004165 [Castanea mollissima]